MMSRSKLAQPVQVLYCEICTLPPEYCEFGSSLTQCKQWLRVAHPQLYGRYYSQEDPKSKLNTPSPEAQTKLEKGNTKKEVKTEVKADVPFTMMASQVSINRIERKNHNFVTVIHGLEAFDVGLKKAAGSLCKNFSTNAFVAKDAQGQDEIVVQSDVAVEVLKLVKNGTGIFKGIPPGNVEIILHSQASPVLIKRIERNEGDFLTAIHGLKALGVKLNEAAKFLAWGLATRASVTKNVRGKYEIVAQGDVADGVLKLIESNPGVFNGIPAGNVEIALHWRRSPVLITRAKRKSKLVTVIHGLEPFGVKPKKAVGFLAQKFATGATVSKDVQGKDEIVVQGDVADAVLKLIENDSDILKGISPGNVEIVPRLQTSQVLINRNEYKGGKFVTIIHGLEAFDIHFKKTAGFLAWKLATHVFVTKNARGQDEIVIQGDLADDLLLLLANDTDVFKGVLASNIEIVRHWQASQVSIKHIKRDRPVTTIHGLEAFDVELKRVTGFLAWKFATRTFATKNTRGREEVVILGDVPAGKVLEEIENNWGLFKGIPAANMVIVEDKKAVE